MSIEVTLCITTYNRREKFEACLESFLKSNVYPWEKLELIVVDNGSTDPSALDLLHNMKLDIFGSFTRIINGKNDYPYCLRRAKNQARAIARGKYFIDCPDDQLFVVKYDWISEIIRFLESSEEKISCVCHYAYPQYRFYKSANKIQVSSVDENFFTTPLKGYADYHVMKKETYEDIGKYDETLEFSPNSESDYMLRSKEKGYKRALYKFPVSILIDKDTGWRGKYAILDAPLDGDSVRFSVDLKRPLTNEELTRMVIDSDCLKVRNLPAGID